MGSFVLPLFAREMGREYGKTGISVSSLCFGVVGIQPAGDDLLRAYIVLCAVRTPCPGYCLALVGAGPI